MAEMNRVDCMSMAGRLILQICFGEGFYFYATGSDVATMATRSVLALPTFARIRTCASEPVGSAVINHGQKRACPSKEPDRV